MLLLTANWQSVSNESSGVAAFKLEQSQMQGVNQKMRDDDDEAAPAEKKKDEVDALMQKYDDEEKHEEYLKSPEYKAE